MEGDDDMHRKMTITLQEDVYEGLYLHVGRRSISRFIEELVRPHVTGSAMEKAYREMAEDTAREAEAQEWCNALSGDAADAAR